MTLRANLLRAIVLAALLALPVTAVAKGGNDDHLAASAVNVGELGPDSARVSGTVRTGGETAYYWFQYGPTAAYGHFTQATRAPSAANGVPAAVSALLAKLPAATLHHVRLVAASGDGRALGPDATFTTAAAPATTPTAPPTAAPAAPAPQLGATVVTAVVSGAVAVRPPGAPAFHPLGGAEEVAVGSIVDAHHGAVELRSAAAPGGAVQAGRFGGGRFLVRQRRTGMTELHLRGGSFAGCRTPHGTLARTARKRPRRVRSLWGSDHGGRFRTYGRDSVATVRGTRWSVVDRCDGTLTRVSEGAVDVRELHGGGVVHVRAGHRHLARHRP